MNPEGLIVLTTKVPGTAVPPMFLYLQGMAIDRLTDLCTLELEE